MTDPVREHIIALLSTRYIRLTPADLERTLIRRIPSIQRRTLRSTIKGMVAEGVLAYTNHFSTTHLELNFNRPSRVAHRIWIGPSNCAFPHHENGVSIKLNDGTAFGAGDHPTTRLCLQGLEYALDNLTRIAAAVPLKEMTALDMGTGSDVLAIAAVGLGLGRAVGVDIDPLACREAKINVALNRMQDRIQIVCQPVSEDDPNSYQVVLANLRPPTLKSVLPPLVKISDPRAFWVVSGFRQEEEKRIKALLASWPVQFIWSDQSCGWAALVVAWKGNKRRRLSTGAGYKNAPSPIITPLIV
jgi:ribosomal protein L11 methyltransferase